MNLKCMRQSALLSLALVACLCSASVSHAQSAIASAALVVDGNVKNVFRGTDQYLVQVLVQRSEATSAVGLAGSRYPAPGEYVYVHVGEAAALASMPKIQSRVRVFLGTGEAGQWEAVGRDWFQENPSTDFSQAGTGFGAPAADALGIMSQTVNVGNDTGLKVTQVKPGSPAAAAGIEVGDILVEVDRMALRSQDQLSDRFARSNGKISLTVRDVRTGRDVLVEVAGAPAPAGGPMQPFGAITELAFYNGEATVKVTSVSAGSPAQEGWTRSRTADSESQWASHRQPQGSRTSRADLAGQPGIDTRRSQG